MVWEQHFFGQIMDTNTNGKIAHLSYLWWAFFHSPRIFKRQALKKHLFVVYIWKVLYIQVEVNFKSVSHKDTKQDGS